MSKMTRGKLERKIEAIEDKIAQHTESVESTPSKSLARIYGAVIRILTREMEDWQYRLECLIEREKV